MLLDEEAGCVVGAELLDGATSVVVVLVTSAEVVEVVSLILLVDGGGSSELLEDETELLGSGEALLESVVGWTVEEVGDPAEVEDRVDSAVEDERGEEEGKSESAAKRKRRQTRSHRAKPSKAPAHQPTTTWVQG